MGVFTGTLLGAEGEREQLTLSCSVNESPWQRNLVNGPKTTTLSKLKHLRCFLGENNHAIESNKGGLRYSNSFVTGKIEGTAVESKCDNGY